MAVRRSGARSDYQSLIIGRCSNCGWFRAIVTDIVERNRKLDHRTYGLITQKDAAYMDVKLHTCESHRSVLALLPWKETK